jgi:hypothetical protein
MEILDRNIRKRIEAKERLRAYEMGLVANGITAECSGERWVLMMPSVQRFELILENWEISRSTVRLLQGATSY